MYGKYWEEMLVITFKSVVIIHVAVVVFKVDMSM